MRSNRKKTNIIIFVVLLLSISLGYAFVNSDLKLGGTATVTKQSWNVYFDNLNVKEGSVTPVTAASLSGEYPTTVNYSVSLEKPGDYYEFTVDAVNGGTIDAMVDMVSSTDNGNPISLPNYIEYKACYYDDVTIEANQLLAANTRETYRVGIYFKNDLNEEDLEGAQPIDLKLKFEVVYTQADKNATIKPLSFGGSRWSDLIDEYNAGDPHGFLANDMNNGTLRAVNLDLDHNGTYEYTTHLRIANLSKPQVCSNPDFSQSGCGFVVEFAEALDISLRGIGKEDDGRNGTGIKGGWKYSAVRALLNGTKYLENEVDEVDYNGIGLIDALPADLSSLIIDTMVVSNSSSVDNRQGVYTYVSTDKIYNLAIHEVFEGAFAENDRAYDYTRRLDYYEYNNVLIFQNNEAAIKKRTGRDTRVDWQLRSYDPSSNPGRLGVSNRGNISTSGASRCAPAFRIAN